MKKIKTTVKKASPFNVKYSVDYMKNVDVIEGCAIKKSDLKNSIVRIFYYSHKPGTVICGVERAIDYIRNHTSKEVTKICAKFDGEILRALEPIMFIEGYERELVQIDSIVRGMLSYSGPATYFFNFSRNFENVLCYDTAVYPPEIIEEMAFAAYIGNMSGVSSKAGVEYVKNIVKKFTSRNNDNFDVHTNDIKNVGINDFVPSFLNIYSMIAYRFVSGGWEECGGKYLDSKDYENFEKAIKDYDVVQ